MPDFLPRSDGQFLLWSSSFDRIINESAVELGLTIEQAEEYRARHLAFAEASRLASSGATRGVATIFSKDLARASVTSLARALAAIVRSAPGVSPQQRLALNLSAPATTGPTRINRPA